jgi:hypothetical protein
MLEQIILFKNLNNLITKICEHGFEESQSIPCVGMYHHLKEQNTSNNEGGYH